VGELEAGIGAAVVPVFNAEGDIVAALALVATQARFDQQDDSQLRQWLEPAAAACGAAGPSPGA
jgi:DNA-binding IclR family transcriptional regulator